MTLVKYNTNGWLPATFNDFIDRFLTDGYGNAEGNFVPSFDVAETEKEFEIQVAAPGMDKKDFNIELNNGLLTVSGERKFNNEEKGKNFHKVESRYGSFNRSVYLPDYVAEDKISASYKDGILHVVIPKNQKKTKVNSIEVK